MTNREELLDILRNMSDRELAESIDLYCNECPVSKHCDLDPYYSDLTCQDSMEKWLEEGEE